LIIGKVTGILAATQTGAQAGALKKSSLLAKTAFGKLFNS